MAHEISQGSILAAVSTISVTTQAAVLTNQCPAIHEGNPNIEENWISHPNQATRTSPTGCQGSITI